MGISQTTIYPQQKSCKTSLFFAKNFLKKQFLSVLAKKNNPVAFGNGVIFYDISM